MKLNIFSKWKPLGTLAARKLEYLTQKGGTNTIVTVVRDSETGHIITKGYGQNPEISQKAAYNTLKRAGVDAILDAVKNNKPIGTQITPAPKEQAPKKDIDWRDGVGHSYKAQKKIVGESFEEALQLDPDFEAILKG